MSSYYTFVTEKSTGERKMVFCRDDYFGDHIYGYAIIENNDEEPKVYTYDGFIELYTFGD